MDGREDRTGGLGPANGKDGPLAIADRESYNTAGLNLRLIIRGAVN
jgi:hypothetical protein